MPTFEIDPKEVALIGQAVEHEFVNVPCGIMDQFISANGKKGMALKLDCATLEYELVPMNNESVSVLVLDSAVKHSLADGAYGQRRKQCEEASSIMGVPSCGKLRWSCWNPSGNSLAMCAIAAPATSLEKMRV